MSSNMYSFESKLIEVETSSSGERALALQFYFSDPIFDSSKVVIMTEGELDSQKGYILELFVLIAKVLKMRFL